MWRMPDGLEPHSLAATSRFQGGGEPCSLQHPKLAESSELESQALSDSLRLANEPEPCPVYSPNYWWVQMESNHHRLVKSQMHGLRAMNPKWSPVTDSNGLPASTNRVHHHQCLRGERGARPGESNAVSPEYKPGASPAMLAGLKTWSQAWEFHPAPHPYQGRVPVSELARQSWHPETELNGRNQASEAQCQSPLAGICW